MRKKLALAAAAVALSLIMCMPVFAMTQEAGGQAGWVQDETGWRWRKSDGTYMMIPCWIDGNNDGVYEYYYFDDNGYLYTDISFTLYDIYPVTVNADGAQVKDGAVVTYKPVRAKDIDTNFEDETYNQYGLNRTALKMVYQSREENAPYGEVAEWDSYDYHSVSYANGFVVNYPKSYYHQYLEVDKTRAGIDNTLLLKFYYDSTISDRVMDTEEKDSLLRELGLPITSDPRHYFDEVFCDFDVDGKKIHMVWYCSNKLYLYFTNI